MRKQLIIGLFVFAANHLPAQVSGTKNINLEKAKLVIDSLDRQFEQHFYHGDSLALYNMYARGAQFGTVKGEAILSSWGKQIRHAIQNDTRTIKYTTLSLSTDNEFLIEVGTYDIRNSQGESKYQGKYLVVWKYEDGTWKLYRDMGL